VQAVREVATARQGRQVGTVGRLEVEPNSPNVVPGRVTLSVEFRDLSEATLRALGDDVRARAEEIARSTGTRVAFTLASTNPSAPADPGVQDEIGAAADRVGLEARRLPSGAGHDAQMIAAICPMGMIFVPSVGGISHSPREMTSWDDCARGASVLLGAVLRLAG
jgi:N-carbamoyl-L-amino-acid hydrolase